MKPSFSLSHQLSWMPETFHFTRTHAHVLFTLGIVAAFGRAIQLGAFGLVSPLVNILLEIIIESSRLIIFIYVLGLANIRKGTIKIKQLVSPAYYRKINWSVAFQKAGRKWPYVLLNLVVFLVIASVINYLINLLAYQTCLYVTLRRDGIISPPASEWVIILFFKNLSVIPFTIVFNSKQHTLETFHVKEGATGLGFYQVTHDVSVVHQLLHALYQLKIQSVLVEGGSKLLQSFIDEQLWDEARVITNSGLNIGDGILAPSLSNHRLLGEYTIISDQIHYFANTR
jgi:hypothetical protein